MTASSSIVVATALNVTVPLPSVQNNIQEEFERKLAARMSGVRSTKPAATCGSKIYTAHKKELAVAIVCVASLAFTAFSMRNLETCDLINSYSKSSCDAYVGKAVLGVMAVAFAALTLVDPNMGLPYRYMSKK